MSRCSTQPNWIANALAGTIRNAMGQRVCVSPSELIAAIADAMTHEVGDAASEICSRIGSDCGSADMRDFMDRANQEFGVELPKVHMGAALLTWWQPWAQDGWGRATFDFQQAAQQIVRIEVSDSAVARARRSDCRPTCDLLGGIFAGAFQQLCRREVGCVEVHCQGAGDAACRFLVTTPIRAESAVAWRDAGASAEEIERRIKELAKDRAR